MAMTAGLVTLRRLGAPGVFDATAARTQTLLDGLLSALRTAEIPATGTAVGTMFGVFFRADPVQDHAGAAACDTACFARFHAAMLSEGVYLAPSAFEAGFVSTAHDDAAIDATIAAAQESARVAAAG